MTATVPPATAAPEEGEAAAPPAWRLALPAVVAGVALAVVGLDRRSLWLDEAFSLGATNQLAETISGTSGTMVGYYLLLTPWTAVSESVGWLRLLSVLCAAAALLPLAALARRIGASPLAVRATVAAALAAQTTRYAQEARSYALVVLVVTTSWWLFVRAVEEDDPDRRRRLTQVLAGLGGFVVLAHGLAVLNVVALAVAAVACPRRDRAVRVAAPALVVALAVVGLLLSSGANDVGTWVPALSADQVATAAGAYTSPLWWAALPLGALVLLGAVTALRSSGRDPMSVWRDRLAVIWVAVPVAGLLALSVVRPSFDHRYLIGIIPGVALLLARGTLAVDGRLPRRAAPVGVAALVAVALLVPGQVEVHTDGYDDWHAAAALVADGAEPGDGVIFAQAFHRTPFEAAWRDVPHPGVTPDLPGFDRPLGTVRRHDEPRTEVDLAGHDRLWLVVAAEPGLDADLADAALARDELAERFTVARDVEVGGDVRVLLLVPR